MVIKLNKQKSAEKGFTLIEVIVSLVIIAILSAVTGLGVVQITQGYIFTKQNAETLQKAQIAMDRMIKELGAVCSTDIALCSPPPGIATAAVNSISYKRLLGLNNLGLDSNTIVNHTITLSGSSLQIDSLTLIDQISSFTLTYYDTVGNPLTPPVANTANIGRVVVSFTTTRANNNPFTFTNSVNIAESYW
jgi:prepilin-type N-terminal cleavage/methylation domain-containing protein